MLARLAPTMACPNCEVVGGLRLEWRGVRGLFSCHCCGQLGSEASPSWRGRGSGLGNRARARGPAAGAFDARPRSAVTRRGVHHFGPTLTAASFPTDGHLAAGQR
jgi:hypothetical protein